MMTLEGESRERRVRKGRQNDRRFRAHIGSRESRQLVTGRGCLVCRSEQFFRSPSLPCVQK